MKGGFCVIYTSLLTISVVSSCALFILVVSEALQGEGDINTQPDLSGLHNVSKKVPNVDISDVPSTEPPIDEGIGERTDDDQSVLPIDEMIFAETLSLNAVTTDGLPDTGQPPILISLADNAKLDLKNTDELLYTNESEQHNDTKTFTIVDSSEIIEEEKPPPIEDKEVTAEPTLIVKAKPMHEARQAEDAATTPAPTAQDEVTSNESQSLEPESPPHPDPVKPDTPQEDIPSFSEWAQKQLAEAEKQDTVLNHSTQTSHSNTNFSSKNTKIRSKNYASPACGAKIVAVNPEAGSASSILSPNRDEYMLNTCNSRIWFVVELCEAVQAQKIEIANFELFSSTPKDIAVYFSDRFPTRDWASVGQFAAEDMRDVQSFDLYPHMFGKFIKVEMLSHHGSEHYCPISLFKVYGTSEFEVLEKESSQHAAHLDDDEDDDIIDVPDIPAAEAEASKNLFGSARDAVMSIMKKAAQALVKTEVPKNATSVHNDTSKHDMYKKCCSPSHIIVCDNCSETLYNDVFELISCSSDRLTNLLRQVFLRDTLKCTGLCRTYGLDFKSTNIEFGEERLAYMKALFPENYLAALCNILAIKEKKVVLNTSFESDVNVTVPSVNETENVDSEVENEQIKLVPDPNGDDEKVNESIEVKPADNEIADTVILEEIKTESIDIDKEEPVIPEQKPIEQNESTKAGDEASTNLTETPKTDEPKAGKVDSNCEKKEPTTDELSEQMLIESDSYISDFDQLTVDPTPAGQQSTQNQNPGQTAQKESVFLRLSNRVKTLERNMSLSGQYLEELSRRYKKQVEEMQKTFEKTILQMTEERRKSNDREQKYLDQMTNMQEQLIQMASAMKILMEERESWFGNITFFKFLIFQSLVVTALIYYVSKRKRAPPIVLPIPKKVKKKEKVRRKSVEGVSGHATPAAKKRRPSEEALQIARQSTEDVTDDGGWQIARKNRRRKTSILHREETKLLWGRQDSVGKLQENPIALDDDEFLAPVSEPAELNENVAVNNLPKKELPKNGIFNIKTIKTRRLSSPAFLRTFSRQSSRSTPSPAVRSLEPVFNGDMSYKTEGSPNGSLWSQSTEMSQTNGYDLDKNRSKKKKSFKNIFKKVF